MLTQQDRLNKEGLLHLKEAINLVAQQDNSAAYRSFQLSAKSFQAALALPLNSDEKRCSSGIITLMEKNLMRVADQMDLIGINLKPENDVKENQPPVDDEDDEVVLKTPTKKRSAEELFFESPHRTTKSPRRVSIAHAPSPIASSPQLLRQSNQSSSQLRSPRVAALQQSTVAAVPNSPSSTASRRRSMMPSNAPSVPFAKGSPVTKPPVPVRKPSVPTASPRSKVTPPTAPTAKKPPQTPQKDSITGGVYSSEESNWKEKLPQAIQERLETHKEKLKSIEDHIQQTIMREIVAGAGGVRWEDIVGLELAKRQLHEMVVLPARRPDLFQGLRQPPKGLLLFGPPGNGKTLIAKALADQSGSIFFSISASSLTSKYLGESEKLMRGLFTMAEVLKPSIIFIDEIDSLLSARSANEHEASRRLKTEFLVKFDGVTSDQSNGVIVLGATNRPQELDDAVIRRMVKRIYIPLPCFAARRKIIENLLAKESVHSLSDKEIDRVANLTEGYSASDITALCKDAAFEPIRVFSGTAISDVAVEDVRPVSFSDFEIALKHVRRSVSTESLQIFQQWNREYGCANI